MLASKPSWRKKPSSTAAIAGKYDGETRSGIATRSFTKASLHLQPGCAYRLCPELEVFAQRAGEIGRRAADGVDADLLQPRGEGAVLARRADLAREARDH